MKDKVRLRTPLSDDDILKLKIGDKVLLSGTVYTARDAAHKRLVEEIKKEGKPPFDLNGQVIYYTGPSPTPPGKITGSIGPTTSSRMDPYVIYLLKAGLKGMIGKGYRCREVKDAMKEYKAVYFAAIGGVGALLAKHIKDSKVIAYEDLGTEAIHKLDVEDFPLIVVNDAKGCDLYQEGVKKYKVNFPTSL